MSPGGAERRYARRSLIAAQVGMVLLPHYSCGAVLGAYMDSRVMVGGVGQIFARCDLGAVTSTLGRASDLLGTIGLALCAIALGLACLGFGFTGMGRMWPHPRAFWGGLGVCIVLLGLGVALTGLQGEAPAPPQHDLRAILGDKLGVYVLMFALLLMGIWGMWAYLIQHLWTVKPVMTPDTHFEIVRVQRLRRRQVVVAAMMIGIAVAVDTVAILHEFSSEVVALLTVGCLMGGFAFAVIYGVLRLRYRYDLI
jgi:hypothetical protein